MAWNSFATPVLGKAVRSASRLLHHGGSALPGKVIERFDPSFLARTLERLPYGVVLVSGTNGKTTTTRMVASILTDLGFKVFTNPTGSNFTRGVVSALLAQVDLHGRLDADIAVLELDEAYAVKFVQQVKPRYALLLNVMRDQLDRFGEIDNTARLLGHVAATTNGTVVLNREDRRIAALAGQVPQGTQVRYFGLSERLRRQFPSDDDMHNNEMHDDKAGGGGDTSSSDTTGDDGEVAETDFAQQEDFNVQQVVEGQVGADQIHEQARQHADVVLEDLSSQHVRLCMDDAVFQTDVRLEGLYNLYNAAAALAVVRAVMADVRVGNTAMSEPRAEDERLIEALSHVTPAFGRGETVEVDGTPVQLLLVKNPMGFRMSLASFPPQGCSTMIAINDEYADGRDMSWLWDVDFSSLRGTGVAEVSGVRAWDMALRLGYDQVAVGHIDSDLTSALRNFVRTNPNKPKHVYCTYTAMLAIRAELAKITDVPDAGVGR